MMIKERGMLLEKLTNLYDSEIEITQGRDPRMNLTVIDAFSDKFESENALFDGIASLIKQKSYIRERIKSRLNLDPFWSQPVALLAYFVVFTFPSEANSIWPYASSHDAIEKIYSDLGKSNTSR